MFYNYMQYAIIIIGQTQNHQLFKYCAHICNFIESFLANKFRNILIYVIQNCRQFNEYVCTFNIYKFV